MTYTAIIYHWALHEPIVQNISEECKFVELCEMLPTDWAHLMNLRTGEIVSSWSNSDVSGKNN
jgi:hypothetical protein